MKSVLGLQATLYCMMLTPNQSILELLIFPHSSSDNDSSLNVNRVNQTSNTFMNTIDTPNLKNGRNIISNKSSMKGNIAATGSFSGVLSTNDGHLLNSHDYQRILEDITTRLNKMVDEVRYDVKVPTFMMRMTGNFKSLDILYKFF